MSRSQRHRIDWRIALSGIDDLALEGVGLEVVISIVLRFQMHVLGRQLTDGLNVGVHLKIDAALELGTLACQILRVERNVLEAGSTRGYRHKTGHPCGTAQGPAAGADSTDASCLLAGTDLLHLDANPEHVGQHLDQLAKVYSIVSNIIENGLIAVALILNVADFHLQTQVHSNLAGTDHRVLFAGLGLLIAFHVGGLGLTEHA